MSRITLSLSFIILLFSTLIIFTQKAEPSAVRSAQETPKHQNVVDNPTKNKTAEDLSFTASSIYAVDVDSGKVLFQKNPDLLVPPASTTKIMTALTVVDSKSFDSIITVPYKAITVDGQKMHLISGEKISFESLLYGLLVFSGNDAAETLAQTYPGGRESFIEAMNIKARQLGLRNSTFKNPTGLDENGHLSTAKEMAYLGKHLMDDTRLRTIVGTKNASVYSVDLKFSHYLPSTNELLASVPGVLGIKTGWTEEARENLVTYIDRGHPIIIALLGSDDRFGETKKLIDWIYKNYQW